MYLKIVLTLLTVACLTLAVELAALARRAPRGTPTGAGVAGAGAGLLPFWPEAPDPVLDRTLPRFDVPRMPLEKALNEFRRQTGANVVLQYGNLSREQLETPVEAHLRDVLLTRALEAILRQVDFVIHFSARDNVIVIGNDPALDGSSADRVTRLYDVSSLLPPGATAGERRDAVQELVRLIALQENAGGDSAGIGVWGNVLVVNRTPEGQREIARLLETLRARRAGAPGDAR